ncbi:vWA domain-containing protein [Oceanobacter kriegii]|uniref:vWA domain-containing protein n=1 Tax=Oceanobacter kriegii TaxID=64972 RepID=UPI00041C316A|nr:VWA domain-containing protein [Oceanobacter kriegii]
MNTLLAFMESLQWHWPWAFVLLPLPLLARAFLTPRQPQQSALRVSRLQQWSTEQQNAGPGRESNLKRLLALLAWCCLVTAVARPFQMGEAVPLPQSGRDLMLAVDISGSMQVEDMQVSGSWTQRLNAVKYVVNDFIDQRQGDRLGLILFGSNAYVQSPLTFDRETVRKYLLEAQIGLAGEQTAIGDAIGLGVKRLLSQPSDSRVIVLLTDGANTAGEVDPVKAAGLAADNQVRIYTIALGADSMVVPSIFGSRRVNPSRDLDETTLTEIARVTGGEFYRARNFEELQKIYDVIDQLEPTEKDPEQFRPQHSLFQWPLGVALTIAMLLWLAQAAVPAFQRLSHKSETDPVKGGQ